MFLDDTKTYVRTHRFLLLLCTRAREPLLLRKALTQTHTQRERERKRERERERNSDVVELARPSDGHRVLATKEAPATDMSSATPHTRTGGPRTPLTWETHGEEI